MSQIIQHKSRYTEYTINFESGTTIQNTALEIFDDGEVYEVISTNTSSWNIGGFTGVTFNVTNLTNPIVSIVKTTPGQTAQLIIRKRKTVNQLKIQSVPDLSIYNGRYLYVFLTGGKVRKYDSSLLTPANYAGSGTWTINPFITEITLPTLPGVAVWSSITFVKHNGIPRMILQGGLTNSWKVYGCYIKCSDDTVWNLDETVQNSYTTLVDLTTQFGPGYTSVYDYVNEIIYWNSVGGANGVVVNIYNLLTKVASNYFYGSIGSNFFNMNSNYRGYPRPIGYLKEKNKLVNNYTTMSQDSKFNTCNVLNVGNLNVKGVAIDPINKRIFTQAQNTIGRIWTYDFDFNFLGGYDTTSGTSSGQLPELGYLKSKQEVLVLSTSVTPNNYAIYQLNGGYRKGFIFQNPLDANYPLKIGKSNYNGNWYCSRLTRLHVINTSEVIPDFGYIDMAANINDSICDEVWE